MNNLIGVAGRMYAGKDTLGAYLVEKHGYTRVAFADKVKEAVVALDPVIDVATAYSSSPHWRRLSELRKTNETPVELCNRLKVHPEMRRLMQAMGNEVGQGIFGRMFWIDLVLGQQRFDQKVVITDVRYPHEAKAIREVGGCVIRIVRPSVQVESSHPSETMVDECEVDVEVDNTGTIENFLEYAEVALSAC